MKEFNLEAALNGELVRLRQGSKAYVVGKIPSNLTYEDNELIDYPLIGVVLDENGYLTGTVVFWTINGKCSEDGVLHDADIIGMWEEPKIRIEDLPKPFRPKDGEPFYYIYRGKAYYDHEYSERSPTYRSFSRNGQCFRSEKDAKKWLDFMKSMME